MKKAWVLSYPLSAQWRPWSDWADAQADLSLLGTKSFCWFCHKVAHSLFFRYHSYHSNPIFCVTNYPLYHACNKTSTFIQKYKIHWPLTILSRFSTSYIMHPEYPTHKPLEYYLHTVKIQKIRTTKNCCNYPKIWTNTLLPLSNGSKTCRRNSKQCRHWSDCSFSSLIRVYTVQKLRIITINHLNI